jgi:cytoskeletal protein CcmA (bactofilin family)
VTLLKCSEEQRFRWEEPMFGSRRGRTVIGDGLKILGNVTTEGLIEINGQIEGDLHCTSLIVSPKGRIVGSITAEQVGCER